MTDIRSMEHHTLKVPYELLNKKFRLAQKVLDREASHVQAASHDLEKALKQEHVPEKLTLRQQQPNLYELLGTLEERLLQFRAKSHEAVSEEVEVGQCCKRRVDHLKDGCQSAYSSLIEGNIGTANDQSQAWRKTRLDRMLVEHFLRSGYYDSAIGLAQTAGIQDLTNINLFLVAKDVEEALTRQDTSKCLAWCHDNKSKLRKMKSTLEFNVRLQEFIELVKKREKLEAVKHARKFMSPNADGPEQLAIIQKGCALFAFDNPNTQIQPYRDLYREDRWQSLIEQFRAENYRLFQLSNQSVFAAALQAGLSALKTPQCYRPSASDRNFECPVCQNPLNQLAAPLPFAHCSQSRLICYMSGKPLNEHNVPMMLPNGYVYGEQALTKMARENNGNIVCPRTKEVFSLSAASKVYVM